MSEYAEDFMIDEPDQALVHWMEPKHLTIGAAGLSGAIIGAFALGALATLGVIALARWIDHHDEVEELLSRRV